MKKFKKVSDFFDDYIADTKGKIATYQRRSILLTGEVQRLDDSIEILKNKKRDNAENVLIDVYRKRKHSLEKIITECKQRVELYTFSQDLVYEEYRAIVGMYNEHQCVNVLKGREWNLSSTLGVLHVKNKEAKFKHINPNIMKVDWGESMKYLQEICSKDFPELLSKYKNKDITKQEFINEYKKVGTKKWFIYRNDSINSWWNWRRFNFTKSYRRTLFNFTPSNFVNTKERSQLAFVKSAKSIDDILWCRELGNRDKLNMLNEFDKDYYKVFNINIE